MGLLAAALLAAVAVAVVLWTYVRREPPVRGRLPLTLLRVGAVLLVVLLLWNPVIPRVLGGEGAAAPAVLVDASLSMSATDSGGSTAWARAMKRAREVVGPDGRVLLFGSSVRALPLDSAAALGPGDVGSSAAPALERAAALGASRVRVLSDLRLEDPVRVSAALSGLGIAGEFEDVGRPIRNAGIEELDVPASLEAGATSTASVLLAGEGRRPGDSVSLELRNGDRLLAARRVPLPGDGGAVRHGLDFEMPSRAGSHRLEVRASLPEDGFGADDVRTALVEVEPDGAELVLLSLEPDWEPRYLLPVLEQGTGMGGIGFLRLDGGRWMAMGQGPDREGATSEDRVRERARRAELLVLHGVDGGAPAWILEAAGSAGRLLLFPDGPGGTEAVDLQVAGWAAGEWYADPDLPASPVAGDLAGVGLDGLPPLNAVLPLSGSPPAGRVVLRVRDGRRGRLQPALVLSSAGGRRAVVVLAAGFWRWGARDGGPREAYRRLWSGAAGWLLSGPVAGGTAAVEPAARPAPRGEPLEWSVRGPVGDTLEVRLEAGDTTVHDTTVVRSGGRVRTQPMPPGPYTYRIRAAGLDGPATGELRVSAYSGDALRARLEPPGPMVGEDGRGRDGGEGRALRTHPVPYLVLLLLLSAEWIGRRRQGLR